MAKLSFGKIGWAVMVFFGASAIGCNAQDQSQDIDYQVDERPMQRDEEPIVTSYASTLEEVRPAVVSVFSRRVIEERETSDHPLFEHFFGPQQAPQERVQQGVGSGMILSTRGFVLTNNHVIADAELIAVRLENGREFEAEVIGRDPQTDIAVLRIEADDLQAAVLADSDAVEVGDVVFALGNALGIGHSVTTGIVSARGLTDVGILGQEGFENFIQTDAAMNIGNSGGPLVDAWGRVIGLNTAIASPGGGNIGIGFAIPINLARTVVEELIEYGEVRRGYLGIQMRNLPEQMVQEFDLPVHNGVLVVNVVPNSPAENAGIEEGDIIIAVNGEAIESPGALRFQVGQTPPEERVDLDLIRNGQQTTVAAVLGRQPQ